MSDKYPNQVTSAGAVELEENDLSLINGGAGFNKMEIKFGEPVEPVEALKIRIVDL